MALIQISNEARYLAIPRDNTYALHDNIQIEARRGHGEGSDFLAEENLTKHMVAQFYRVEKVVYWEIFGIELPVGSKEYNHVAKWTGNPSIVKPSRRLIKQPRCDTPYSGPSYFEHFVGNNEFIVLSSRSHNVLNNEQASSRTTREKVLEMLST